MSTPSWSRHGSTTARVIGPALNPAPERRHNQLRPRVHGAMPRELELAPRGVEIERQPGVVRAVAGHAGRQDAASFRVVAPQGHAIDAWAVDGMGEGAAGMVVVEGRSRRVEAEIRQRQRGRLAQLGRARLPRVRESIDVGAADPDDVQLILLVAQQRLARGKLGEADDGRAGLPRMVGRRRLQHDLRPPTETT